jgi:wobble nucleotide-excising tRNase
MNRVNRISRLRDCGIFRNFRWPLDLPEFGRYNVIYGWNGTGKTTLSRLFRHIELNQAPTTGEAVFRINGSDVPGEEFSRSDLTVRVFNRDFVVDNVSPVGSGDMPPILVLGSDNVEKQKTVERLKQDRVTVLDTLARARSVEEAAQDAIDQFCKIQAKRIKDALRTSGQNRYNNYNKGNYRRDADELVARGDGITHRLADAEREKLLARHRGTSRPPVAELNYALPDFDAIMAQVRNLLKMTVVSAAVDALTSDSTLAEWTRQGVSLHRDRKAKECLFCSQALPRGRLDDLRAHFNDEYDELIQHIDRQIQQMETARKELGAIAIPPTASIYDHLVQEFLSCERGLKDALASARTFLNDAIQALAAKKPRAFEKISVELRQPRIDGDAVQKLNTVIRKHNEECDAFETGREGARTRLARHMIALELQEYLRLRNAADDATADHERHGRKKERLDAEIANLEAEIVEHRQPAEDLNEDLRKYLGHGELRLKIKDTGYSIIRGGEQARTVSEGETTAIALLYFLKSLQDRRFDIQRGVVVLDDPVSSLDANALFLAFSLVQECTKNASQLVILTHNFSFFRQVRNWFSFLNRGRRKRQGNRLAEFFMLESTLEDGVRSSIVRGLDPLLIDYESDYQYLFAQIYETANVVTPIDLERVYALPNMARRMLEGFLAFRRPHVAGGLRQKMKDISFDETKKLRILRFLHAHSHSIGMGEPEHDLTALAEGPSVLHDLLDMMKSEDAGHFAAMEMLVGRSSDGSDTNE